MPYKLIGVKKRSLGNSVTDKTPKRKRVGERKQKASRPVVTPRDIRFHIENTFSSDVLEIGNCMCLNTCEVIGFGDWCLVGILLSAVLAFLVGSFYGQPLHWYLFILIIVVGFFIHTIILILKVNDERSLK